MQKLFTRLKDKMKWPPILGIIALSLVFLGGYSVGAKSAGPAVPFDSGLDRITNKGVTQSTGNLDFRQFWNIWNILETDYINQPVAQSDLFYGALEGIANKLHDPYTTFFDPKAAKQFNEQLTGTFSGIGAELGKKDDVLVVVSPLASGPAQKAGLRAGDMIFEVDGADTSDWTIYEAVQKIRGAEGTKVKLTILSAGDKATREVELTRAKITIDSVTWKQDGKIGVITINQFNEDTNPLFNKAVDELAGKSSGLVIDLRNDPGGLLDQAIKVANFWISDKVVVIEKTRDKEVPYSASAGAVLDKMPTVVLVNGGSASAAEILAGALQDYKLAHLIGETTYGKGSVQDYRTFADGSALKVTIAKWFTPLNRTIDKTGIKPDQEVKLTAEDVHAGKDPQYQAALDYLAAKHK